MKRIWPLVKAALPEAEQPIADALLAWLRSRRHDELSLFLAGETVTPPDTKVVKPLEEDVIADFEPLSEAVRYLRVLLQVVDRGNAEGACDLCLPRIPLLLKRESSPFLRQRVRSLPFPRRWRATLNRSVSTLRDPNQVPTAGQILASAALNGGLVNRSLLIAIHATLSEPLELVGEHVSLERELAWRGSKNKELRRWYPDALTEMLLLRYRTASGGSTPSAVDGKGSATWRAIRDFFSSLAGTETDHPQSLQAFLDAIHLELQTSLPSFLANYAARSFVSHSLKSHVWKRLHGHPVPVGGSAPSNPQAPQAEDLIEAQTTVFEIPWLRRLRGLLGKSHGHARARRALVALQARAPEYPDAAFPLFVDWALYLVTEGSAGGNRLALSTIAEYVSQIAQRLIGLTAFTDLTQLGVEGLEELYEEVLEQAESVHHHRKLARGLREFHHYLQERHGADPINVQAVLGIGTTLAPVDANIVSPDEYRRVLDRLWGLREGLDHPAIGRVAAMVFMLHFRCGLRRLEALKVMIDDFKEHDPAVLLVRPSDHRRLKTKNSVRKIPLYALLSEKELGYLRWWKKTREEEEGRNPRSPFLFGIPSRGYGFVPEEVLYPVIHHVLREETGDPTLHAHHLRHSFACWTLMKLALSEFKTSPVLFAHLPETGKFLQGARELRRRLYENDHPTRKHLFAIASLLGHSGPEMSLGHYIHVCDLLLWQYLAVRTDRFGRKELIAASGLPTATAYRLGKKETGTAQLLRAARMRALRSGRLMVFKAKLHAKTHGSKLSEAHSPLLEQLDRLWRFLFHRSAHGTPADVLARRLGFTVQQVAAFEARAAYVRDLRVKAGFHRHRMKEVALDRSKPQQKTRLLCPRLLREKVDLAVYKGYAAALWGLIRDEESRAEWRPVFDYFLDNAWQTKNELVFRGPAKPADAKRYLRFLKALGIPKDRICFVSYGEKRRSRSLARWKDELGLTWRDHFERRTAPSKQSRAAERWLGIRPMIRKSWGDDTEGSYGLRYLLVMTAILMAGL